jgi:hypothetical protein
LLCESADSEKLCCSSDADEDYSLVYWMLSDFGTILTFLLGCLLALPRIFRRESAVSGKPILT